MTEVRKDLVKRLAELADGDKWVTADLLVDEFPPEVYGGGGTDNEKTGLRDELADYEHALVVDYGIELKASTLRNYRATALAWPAAKRVAAAPFVVYSLLRGVDREERLNRYVKKNGGRPLTTRAVARYRSEEPGKGGKPPRPWEDVLRDRVERTVRKILLDGTITKRDDWWNTKGVPKDRKRALIAAMRDIAAQIDGDL